MSELMWRRSSHSGDWGNCVEVALMPGTTALRDSKAPDAGHVRVSDTAWNTFLSQIKAGHYDKSVSHPRVSKTRPHHADRLAHSATECRRSAQEEPQWEPSKATWR